METKFLSVKEAVENGILQEINRLLLHRMGLAICVEVEKNEDGSLRDEDSAILKIIDDRLDSEGFYFEWGTEERLLAAQEKADKFQKIQNAKQGTRLSRLGYDTQPIK